MTDIPVIRGDGVHDDSDGIQAMIDGKPYRTEGVEALLRDDGIVELGAGVFMVSEPVKIPSAEKPRSQ